MLVLSRRNGEAFYFPKIGVTVRVLKSKRGLCRVGIEGPRDIEVLREEVRDQPRRNAAAAPPVKDGRDIWHTLKNQINAAHIGLKLSERQFVTGDQQTALETLSEVSSSLVDLGEYVKTLEATSDRNAVTRATEGPATDATRSPIVLIVEDDDVERNHVRSLLEMSGAEVVAVGTAADAASWLANNTAPNCVLSDMRLPDRDGASLVRDIRKNQLLSSTKVYGLSGLGTPQEAGLSRGDVDGWFAKPFDVNALLKTVVG